MPNVLIEEIAVDAFDNKAALFERTTQLAQKPKQSFIYYLNTHVANLAHKTPRLKQLLQQGDTVYCDGAGIQLAAKILGKQIPTRLTAADWLFELWDTLSAQRLRMYYLGGDPGLVETGLAKYFKHNPNHTFVGWHHGYILKNPAVEAYVLDDIRNAKPDVLFIGMGSPLQEFWSDNKKDQLPSVSLFYHVGATIDFISGKVARCPVWMGNAGFEWLFRLISEPTRLYHRYLVGNPWFLSRIIWQSLRK